MLGQRDRRDTLHLPSELSGRQSQAAAESDDQSVGVRLLGDIRAAFGTDSRLATATLLGRLAAIDDAPWCELLDGRSDKARGSWLAKKLKPYGISPRAVRIGDADPRGYDASDFGDAWRRYLPAHSAR